MNRARDTSAAAPRGAATHRRASAAAQRSAFPKLTITNAGDARERQAHELVTALMSGADVSRDVAAARTPGAASAGDAAEPQFETAVHAAHATGRPLETAARAPLERATGFDFGAVRVHADARADRLARSIGALAFTTGNHVFFRSEAYAPQSELGQALLAHELTHVMQPAAPGLVQRAEDEPSVRQKLASAASGARGVAKRALGIGREARINRYLSVAAAEIDEWRLHYSDYEQSAQPLRHYRYQQWLEKHGNLAEDAPSWNPIHAEIAESKGKKWFDTVSQPYEQSVIENYAQAIALVYALDQKETDSNYRGPKRASTISYRIRAHQQTHLRWLEGWRARIAGPAGMRAKQLITNLNLPVVPLSS